ENPERAEVGKVRDAQAHSSQDDQTDVTIIPNEHCCSPRCQRRNANVIELRRRPGNQSERQIKTATLSKNVVDNPIAEFVVQPHESLKLPSCHIELFVVNSEDDVIGADAGLPGGYGKKRALVEGELLFIQTQFGFFLGAQVLALDSGRRLQTSQRP